MTGTHESSPGEEVDNPHPSEVGTARHPESSPSGRRGAGLLISFLALAVTLAGTAGVMLFTGGETEPELSSSGNAEFSEVTTDQQGTDADHVTGSRDDIDRARTVLEGQIEDGWVPYGGRPALENVKSPDGAWARAGALPHYDVEEGRMAVYDAPEGEVIGYSYTHLGYVPADLADDFDVDAAIMDRYDCDIREVSCFESTFGIESVITDPYAD